ncbi:Peptide deformylase [Buchnera aphidicola (Neophyllaphis podocarpi)]|uniref:peptide deformylase n=1 Tax=Buchnera aphidicola TaxID=9 RepID=UPI0034646FCE
MQLFKIIKYPDKRLRKIAKPVKKINNKIKKIIQKMFLTMLYNQGIGLAATQIDINLKIIVIGNIEEKYKNIVLINPEIIEKRGRYSIEEGCLSIPHKKAFIKRYKYIKIKALDYNGKKIFIEGEKLLSVCIQHELDHLIGKLFIDYL